MSDRAHQRHGGVWRVEVEEEGEVLFGGIELDHCGGDGERGFRRSSGFGDAGAGLSDRDCGEVDVERGIVVLGELGEGVGDG